MRYNTPIMLFHNFTHDCHYTVTSCTYCDTFERFYTIRVKTLYIYFMTKARPAIFVWFCLVFSLCILFGFQFTYFVWFSVYVFCLVSLYVFCLVFSLCILFGFSLYILFGFQCMHFVWFSVYVFCLVSVNVFCLVSPYVFCLVFSLCILFLFQFMYLNICSIWLFPYLGINVNNKE